jgi:hypothetical protein
MRASERQLRAYSKSWLDRKFVDELGLACKAEERFSQSRPTVGSGRTTCNTGIENRFGVGWRSFYQSTGVSDKRTLCGVSFPWPT